MPIGIAERWRERDMRALPWPAASLCTPLPIPSSFGSLLPPIG
jgi:hypothetical protein